MLEQEFTPEKLLELAENFFVSANMSAQPKLVWRNSRATVVRWFVMPRHETLSWMMMMSESSGAHVHRWKVRSPCITSWSRRALPASSPPAIRGWMRGLVEYLCLRFRSQPLATFTGLQQSTLRPWQGIQNQSSRSTGSVQIGSYRLPSRCISSNGKFSGQRETARCKWLF